MYSPVLKAEVNKDFCVGCGQCVKVCPVGAIDLEEVDILQPIKLASPVMKRSVQSVELR